MKDVVLHCGEALDVLRSMPDASVDSIVTDPPAGIGFMGKEWDDFRRARNGADVDRDNVFGRTSAKAPQVGRRGRRRSWQYPVAESGLSDGGNRLPAPTIASAMNPTCYACGRRQRTWKTGPPACSCENPEFNTQDATLDARDIFIAFLTEIMAECLRVAKPGAYALVWAIPRTSHWTGMAIEDAGWVIQDRISHLFGQGFPKHKSKLKPACEDWWLAWKPDRYATPLPGLNACRIGTEETLRKTTGARNGHALNCSDDGSMVTARTNGSLQGRWPANVTLDEEAVAILDEQTGPQQSGGTPPRRPATPKTKNFLGAFNGEENPNGIGRSEGKVSRFFYVAKASKIDRGEGNTHPTVKSTELMRWLCRLITPAGGIVLDCFMGSGSTGVAAVEEKFGFIGIEREPQYFEIAQRRINAPAGPLFAGEMPPS